MAGSPLHPTDSSYSPTMTCSCAATGVATESSPARAIKSGKTPTMAIRDPFIFCARVSDDSLWYLVYGTNVNQPRRGPKTGIRQQGHFDLDLLAKSSSDAPAPKFRFRLKRDKGEQHPIGLPLRGWGGYGELLGWTCFSTRRYTLSYVPSWSTSSAW